MRLYGAHPGFWRADEPKAADVLKQVTSLGKEVRSKLEELLRQHPFTKGWFDILGKE